MQQSLKRDAQWKKPDTKDRILQGPIYMKCPEEANLQTEKC